MSTTDRNSIIINTAMTPACNGRIGRLQLHTHTMIRINQFGAGIVLRIANRGVGTLSKLGGPKIAGTSEVDSRAKRAKIFLRLIKLSRERECEPHELSY